MRPKLAPTAPTGKSQFLVELQAETFRNIRHYEEIAYKSTSVAAGGGLAFVVWLLDSSNAGWTVIQKIGIECAAAVFTSTVLIILIHCGRLLSFHYLIISKTNEAFQAFTVGEYIEGEALFPTRWRRHGVTQTVPFIRALFLVPIMVFMLISVSVLLR